MQFTAHIVIISFRPFPISGNWLCVASMGIIPLCFICDSMVFRTFFGKTIEHLLVMYNWIVLIEHDRKLWLFRGDQCTSVHRVFGDEAEI